MVEQLHGAGLSDPAVLEALGAVPRDLFVPEALVSRAYDDSALPIGEGQTISQPFIIGRMLELLTLDAGQVVLEVGTGTGYTTALLSRLAARVVSMERIGRLAARARQRLEGMGVTNVAVLSADGTLGRSDLGPYDAILVNAGAPDLPSPLLNQLREGGRLLCPVGDASEQLLHVAQRQGDEVRVEIYQDFSCTFVPLVGRYGWPKQPA